MWYQESVIRSVIEASDLVDLVSQYVTLKKSGKNFMGCCPFHNEKTPSFSVSPERQFYHCFGCGESGNVISFVEKMENVPFLEAIEFLADRAGIILPKETNPGEDAVYQKKLRLYEMHRQSANHYYRLLTKNRGAQRYLAERGFNRDTLRTFGLGVSSGEWQDLVRFLSAAKFSEEEMLESGLILRGKNGRLYDRFRNRIMVPIQNIQDKIIGFGGRSYLDAENGGPKYLNSPETLVFSKGTELYHLNRAKKHLVNDRLVIVEGYMDVISLVQHGIQNVTAALGTAFTPYHAKMLSRYVSEVVLCFDGDAAGEKATRRAMGILEQSPLNVRILRLDVQDDPDSFIQKNGKDAFLKAVDQAMTATDFELKDLARQFDIRHSDGKVKYLNGAVACLRKLTNPLEQEMYVRRTAELTGVSPEILLKEVSKPRAVSEPIDFSRIMPQTDDRLPKAYREAQETVLRARLDRGKIGADLDAEDFSPGIYRHLFQLIEGQGEMSDSAVLLTAISNDQEKKLLSNLIFKGHEHSEAVLKESISVIKKYGRTIREKTAIQKIREGQHDDIERIRQLNAVAKSMKNTIEEV